MIFVILSSVCIIVAGFALIMSRPSVQKPSEPLLRKTPVRALEETSDELTERLRREADRRERAEKASWEREFQEKLNEAFMPRVPPDYLEIPLNKNTSRHDEPSKWAAGEDVPKDSLVEIGGFVRGDEVQGNPIWYYDKKSGRFFFSSDVDTHPRHLPQLRNEARDTYEMRSMSGEVFRTSVAAPSVLNPMTKNPMHLTNPTEEGK